MITKAFKALGLVVDSATVEFDPESSYFTKTFRVKDSHGNRIQGEENLERIRIALEEAAGGDDVTASVGLPVGNGLVVRRPGFTGKAERMFAFMDGFLKNDPVSLQKDILDHVEYTVARSRFNFDDFEAYQVNLFLSQQRSL